MEYKRLTGKSECGYNNLDACLNCDLEMDCGLCPYWAKALDRLAELEDKIEQGTLFTVPFMWENKKRVGEYVVVYEDEENGHLIGEYFTGEDAKEEAEKRLKESENG